MQVSEDYGYSVEDRYDSERRKKARRKKELEAIRLENIKTVKCIACCSFILFVASLLFISSYNTFVTAQGNLRAVKSDYIEVQNKIRNLESKIVATKDIKKLKEEAEALGMRVPLNHQVVYIRLDEHARTGYAKE